MMTVRAGISRAAALLLAAATMTVVPQVTQAQGLRLGILGGANFAELRGVDDLDRRTGGMGGVQLIIPFGGLLSLQTEGLVVSSGAKSSSASDDGVSLTYAQVPVLLRLSPLSGAKVAPHAYAGPYLGLRIACKVDFGSVDGDCDDFDDLNSQTLDVGGVVGGGLDFDLGGAILTGGARYNFGVSKVADFETGNIRESAKNGSFSIYAGLSIRLSGR
jgi:hypothetical protein